MKTEELKAQGLTDEQIAFVMAENGKDIGKVQKKLDDMTADRDNEKKKAETAEETLKKFEGVDVDAINKELSDWKDKATKAEAEYNKKISDRDFDDMLKEAISEANGLNATAIRALLKIDDLKASKNQKEDVAAAIKALTEKDDSKMLFKQAEQPKAQFRTTANKKTEGSTGEITSKADIYAKDEHGRYKLSASERQKAIMEHPQFFE